MNDDGKELLGEIKRALKRADHFTQNYLVNHTLLSLDNKGLSVPIRNGFWLIDLKKENSQEEFKTDILIIWWMSKAINSWIDNHHIENDELSKAALAVFKSRVNQWCDWSKL